MASSLAVQQKTNKTVVDDTLASIDNDSDIVLAGVKIKDDLTQAIQDVSLLRTINGAPTLTMTLTDGRREILASGIFGSRVTTKVDAFTFELAQFSKSGTQLTLTSEDQVVAELREHNSVITIAKGKMTHVQFAEMLCKEVGFIKFVTDPTANVIKSLEPLTRGHINKKGVASKVDSWTCLNDLASARGWRCFVRGVDTIYYVPDSFLFADPAEFDLTESQDGVDSIDFDYDKGKKVATCSVTCESGRWQVPPGVTVQLHNEGPADGKWLVQDITKSIFSTQSNITLIHPQPVLPEPSGSTANGSSSSGTYISSTLSDNDLSNSAAVRVAQYAIAAGFRGAGLLTAVQVSFAEDGSHDPTVFSAPNSDGSIDRGLWQINDKAHPNYSDADMRNPLKNAKAAFTISKYGKDWSPWTTYKSGAYEKYRTLAERCIAKAEKLMEAAQAKNDVNEFVNRALAQRGKRYVYGAPVYPHDKSPSSFDCSGLVCWDADQQGSATNLTKHGVRTAADIDEYCAKAGRRISVKQAINTRGALVFENSPATHVVISLGNGDTIEAMDTAYGIREGGFAGRNWTSGGLLPGLDY